MIEDLQILQENLGEIKQAHQWLEHSFNLCENLIIQDKMKIEDLDKLEALTSRYARLVDLILNKLFRSIDAVELEGGGSILDVANRAAKRGIIESSEKAREFKDLRNDIAHEYAARDLNKIFKKVLHLTPEILNLSNKSQKFCDKYNLNPSVD